MLSVEIEAIIGLLTGLIVGLTGASGVLLVVPMLTLILNFSMHTAVGTSLFVDMITPLFVAYSYFKRGNVNLKAGLWLAVGAIIGAQGGALFANKFVTSKLMNIGFILFLFIMAIAMWVKSYRPQREYSNARFTQMDSHKNRLITFGIGLLLGINSGLFGAGGGLMFLLVLLVILKYPTKTAIGTSSLIMAMTSASGTFGYALQGNVDFTTGLILAISAVISGMLSARLANKVPEYKLNRIVGVVFAAIGVLMLILKK